jgi:kumamolisin
MSETHGVLRGSRRVHRAGAQVLGRADPHEWCEVTVKLARPKPLPEPVLQGKPALSLQQLVKDHGAAVADIKKVTAVLRDKYGLISVGENPGARSVRMAGPVESMEKAFDVHLLRIAHEGRFYRGRVGPIHLPHELKDGVVGVFGLDTRPMARRRGIRKTPASTTRALPPPNSRPWYLPAELAQAYNFPGNDGSGQTIGLIELGGSYVASDLNLFAQATGMASVPKVVTVEVEPLSPQDANDPDSIGEVMLDIEVAASICPGATIVAYFSNFTEKGWVDALDAALHDQVNSPSVLSVSWGLAEGQDIWTAQAMAALNDTLNEAAVLGVPVCLAAGDDGSSDQVNDGQAHVDFPASSPYVLCVGGTARKKNGEVVWKDGDGLRADGGGSTGGGVSAVFERPQWQGGIDITSVDPGAIAGRCIPDVSANAAGSTGYFMVSGGQGQVSGGTSAAAPLWAALIARLNKALDASKRLNYPTPLLYQPNARTNGQTLGAVACNDITHGNNDTAAAGGYSAGSGYDAVGGWGSPDGAKLLALLS